MVVDWLFGAISGITLLILVAETEELVARPITAVIANILLVTFFMCTSPIMLKIKIDITNRELL
jgi:hypothetical protein